MKTTNNNCISLMGQWELSGPNVQCKTTIPGDFHSTLIKEKIIPDPFYGFNEQDVLWVGKSDWTITKDFYFNKPASSQAKTILTITQADTFFTLFINDKEVGKGKNQFARHRFDVSEFLNQGNNTIKIFFESAEKCSTAINEKLPYPVPTMKYDVYSPHRNLARKCQCHGGWDWGPCIMVSGIYGDIYLETINDFIFDSINVVYQKEENNWTAKIKANITAYTDSTIDFNFNLSGKNTQISKIEKAKIKSGQNSIITEIMVENPFVWKTSGELKEAGLKQNEMYLLQITGNDSYANEISAEQNICFNELKAISQKDFSNNQPGRSLYFENNGRKIFAKGTNWIPADALPSRMTNERYEDLLLSAVEANYNCIRVWGGGIYENEYFYELCDKYGLIVWQDCMFACALYPMTDDFLNEVKKEIEYQIQRLQSHPCIGLWCGNNENYGALNWFKESNENRVRYLIDYDRLYNGLIGKLIKELDPSRIYWPSSPCSGPEDYGDNWHTDNFGDMHYWSVWHERKSFDAYLSISPRFVSEFGYESFPSLECINSFATKEDYNFTSELMEYHQRSPIGNTIMLENFSRYFQFPVGFENMIYLSQVQQAIAIKTAVDWWRSLNPHCMGAVIWQLNDVWPGPSWSSLEYNGKWKLLHYESKKFFDIVYMPFFIKDNKLHTILCNELNSNLTGTITLSYFDFDGNLLRQKKLDASLKPNETKELFTEDILSDDIDSYFVYAKFNGIDANKKSYTCSNTAFSKVYKHCKLEKTNISCNINKNNNIFEIELSTDKPAFFVALDTLGIKGRFDTNLITLLPNEKQIIKFKCFENISKEKFEQALSIKDLRSTY